jgi:hypothetical protein
MNAGLTLFQVNHIRFGTSLDQRGRLGNGFRTESRSIDKCRGEPKKGYSQGDEGFHLGTGGQRTKIR